MTVESRRTPRSVPGLIGEAFRLYARFPLLFLVLAAGVVVPYRLIVLATTGAGPYTQASLGFGTSMLLLFVEWVLVDPLVSALHVHAVAEVEEGRTPRLWPVVRRGLAVLPLVAAAAIMSGLAFAGGLILLVVPGAYFFLRLAVVAQAAAIERETWLDALRRSWALTEGNVLHVLGFVVCTAAIGFAVGLPVKSLLPDVTSAGSFAVGVAVQVVLLSFTALATALLYFDLRARRALLAATQKRAETLS
ncbi:MAG TPA: hypothetical protein VF009_07550 [Solirubrobacterales bacterium]